MDEKLKKALWDNVSALMVQKYGSENLNRFAKDADLGFGTVTRIKTMETSVGIEILEKIALAFKVPAFVLLCPVAKQKDLLTVFKAYSETDDRGREFLIATSETLLRKRIEPKTGTTD